VSIFFRRCHSCCRPMDDDADRVDFAVLAEHHPGFRAHVINSSDGKARINWNDPAALKALTAATLSFKYHIKWDIPDGSLCPPVPNRATYLRWVDRLLRATVEIGNQGDGFTGIDVGTGASCIYPLLGVALFGHRFLATDTDSVALEWAAKNIEANEWGDRIVTRLQADSKKILEDVLEDDEEADFVVCNPPFFDRAASSYGSGDESDDASETTAEAVTAYGGHGSANPSVPRRDRATVLTRHEHSTEGGEVAFVGRMIEESLLLRERITWYTTMLGRKQSLTTLRQRLETHKYVSIRCTTISRGKTTRWLLGWTFCKFDTEQSTVASVSKRPRDGESQTPAKRRVCSVPHCTRIEMGKRGICAVLYPAAVVPALFNAFGSRLEEMGATQVKCTGGQLSASIPATLLSSAEATDRAPSAASGFTLSARPIDSPGGTGVAIGFALHLPKTTKPLASPPASFAALVRRLCSAPDT